VVKNDWQGVCSYARSVGARFPELVASQWALESNFGKHLSGKWNPFGLKGSGTVKSTQEFYDGQWVTIKDGFIDFPSLAAAIDYLVSHWHKDWQRYKGVNGAPNRYAAARMLKDQGYATDPDYPNKLSRLMKQYAPEPSAMTLIGPKKRPQDFGFKAGDSHLIVNDAIETMKAFSFEGKLLWEIPCVARGQYSDYEWKVNKSDTPPGLYKLGQLYNDYALHGNKAPYDRTLMAYGWAFYDMIDLEGQETGIGRAGIGLHGGGSALGWPGAWAPQQPLVATHGCCRIHNSALVDKVLPLYRKGTVFLSVFQEG
jgi:hypothetical protein